MPKVQAAGKAGWHKTLNSWKRKYTQRLRNEINKRVEDGLEKRHVKKILLRVDKLEKAIDAQRYVQTARMR